MFSTAVSLFLSVKTDFYIIFDGLHTFFKAQLAAVQAEVIVSCIIPGPSCLIMIIITTEFIGLQNEFFHFFFRGDR